MSTPGSELQAWLKALPGKIKAPIAAEVRRQAERLNDAQRDQLSSLLTPPDESGSLSDSIRTEDGSHELEVIVTAGGPSTTTNGYDRALAFQFGTAQQPARDFFYAPYRAIREDMKSKIADVASKAIERG